MKRVWFPQLEKYVDVVEPAKIQAERAKESFLSQINVIDLLFRVIVLIFVALPLSTWVLYVFFTTFTLKGGLLILAIAWFLIVMCVLSNCKPGEISVTFGTLLQAALLLPFTLLATVLLAGTQIGTATAIGGAYSILNEAVRKATDKNI